MSIFEAKMTTIRKTISLTNHQNDWIKAQIAQGGFASDSEVIRELIRKEQDRKQEGKMSKERQAEILEFMEMHRATMTDLALR